MKIIFQLVGLPLYGIMLSMSPAAFSSEHEHHEHREHNAHQHGAALLNIAIEGNSLHIELESPAMNFVGFEHAPKNHEQKHAVEHAAAELKNGNSLFVLTAAAQCSLTEAQVESPMLEQEHNEHEKHDKEMHSEFHANYVFQCKQIKALRTVDVQLFNKFSGTDEIRVQLITSKGQTVKELTAGNHKLVF